jgi:hypothetical protein
MFRSLLALLFLSVAVLGSQSFAAANVQYPKITKTHGMVWLTGKDGRKVTAVAKTRLIEKATLETSLGAEAILELDANRMLVIESGTEVFIPAISWETGESPLVIIKSGSVRWKEKVHEKRAYNIAVRSDLFEMIPPAGDMVFSIEPEKALATVKVYEGSMEFSALNGEESVQVKSGQKVSFQGILEEGKVAYDVLLQGKKIPRGQLGKVQPLAKEDLAAEAKKRKEQEAREAKERRDAAKAAAAFDASGMICSKPSAKFNQCAWICEGATKKDKKDCPVTRPDVSCVRYRCNANGEWAEKTVLNAQNGSKNCTVQPVVATCDY